jgi:uncharacterized SAM-binding protein YcdF (DUF218 family)
VPYALDKTVIALLTPMGTALCLLLLGGGFALFKRPRTGWLLVLAAGVWLAVWSTPWASYGLRQALEGPYPPVPVAATPPAPAIVLLGGGTAPPAPGFQYPNLNQAADRIWHTARLYRAGKAPLIVLSGGSGAMGEATPQANAGPPQVSLTPAGGGLGAAQPWGRSEALAMQQLLLEWGIPASAMLLEDTSRNTAENARFSAALLRQRGISQVLLVTSALHMPRAVPLFEAQGLKVIPAAADHEGRATAHWPWWQRFLPEGGALDGSARAIKEWVGRWVG